MKQNYTLHLFSILCIVIVFVIYPIKNYSAIVKVNDAAWSVDKVEKPVAQQSTETLQLDFLFKY